MWAGYEVFTPDAGKVEEMHCRVCNAKCLVERNVYGSRGFAAAMARKKSHFDHFYCPYAEMDWHEQALKIMKAIEEMPSKRVAALMQKDLDELLEQNAGKEPV